MQLFNSFDPSPFHSRALDEDAEDYIYTAYEELPSARRIIIEILVYEGSLKGLPTTDVEAAVRSHFAYRARSASHEIKRHMRRGRQALLLGVLFLGACILGRSLIGPYIDGLGWASFFYEGLTIIGWVALWEPVQILLYGWWPILQKREILLRISSSEIRVSGCERSGDENSHFSCLRK